jgi:hypothetical protein
MLRNRKLPSIMALFYALMICVLVVIYGLNQLNY